MPPPSASTVQCTAASCPPSFLSIILPSFPFVSLRRTGINLEQLRDCLITAAYSNTVQNQPAVFVLWDINIHFVLSNDGSVCLCVSWSTSCITFFLTWCSNKHSGYSNKIIFTIKTYCKKHNMCWKWLIWESFHWSCTREKFGSVCSIVIGDETTDVSEVKWTLTAAPAADATLQHTMFWHLILVVFQGVKHLLYLLSHIISLYFFSTEGCGIL